MNIYLIRHGRQDSTKCNDNVALCEVGREQARLVGERLKHYPLDALYSSNLIRAKETAQVIKEVLEEGGSILPYETYEDLREISFGEMEGIENAEVKKRYMEFFAKRDLLEEDLPNPGGESGQDVYNRSFPIIEQIAASGYENVAIVTHGGTIRSLIAGILGMPQARRFLLGVDLENCSITQIAYYKQKQCFHVERFNDYAHIETRPELLRKSW